MDVLPGRPIHDSCLKRAWEDPVIKALRRIFGWQGLLWGLLLFLGAIPSLLAQGSPTRHHDLAKPLRSFIHESWTAGNGLEHPGVDALAQTPDGYLWLGTQTGVVRFDGASFRAFDTFNTPGMVRDWVTSFAVGQEGTLWMGCQRGAVQALDRSGISDRSPVPPSTPFSVYSILVDGAGAVWTAIPGSGLWRRTREGWQQVVTGRPQSEITDGYADSDGSIWLGCQDGSIAHVRDGKFRWYGRGEGMPAALVKGMTRDAQGRLLFGTDKGGLHVLEKDRVRPLPAGEALAKARVTAMVTDSSGRTWIGTYNQGLYVLQQGRLSPALATRGGPPMQVRSLLIDQGSNLWFGTVGDGLHLLRSGAARLAVPFEGGMSNQVLALAVRGNDLFLGLRGSGFRLFRDGVMTAPPMTPKLAAANVDSLLAEVDGTLWAGSELGLFRIKHGRTEAILTQDGRRSLTINALLRDREGTLWVGGIGGLFRLRSGQLEPVAKATGLATGVIVNCMLQDRQGELWFGTDGAGLAQWHGGNPIFHRKAEGLPHDAVLTLLEGTRGDLWVGTNGAGLARLAGGRWGRLGTDQGLPDNHIDAILRDDSGKLWIATNSGLFGAAEQDFIAAAEGSVPFLHGAALHVKDGLPSSDFLGGAQSAAARSADGTLWFISEKGVVGIDPKLGTRSPAPPPVHIEQVVVDGQVKEASEGLRLGPGARTLEFRFVGIDFLNPAGTSYRYRLDGFDRDWVEGGRQRRATYTNLPPGSYTFRVQAVNSTGVWNRSGAALRLTLLPLFRQTRWFAGLCIFLAGAVVFGLYRWRMWKLRRRERELQVRVDEALAQAHVLSGLLPICAGCKKIRDDKGYWNQIEIYIRDHTDASFSHGICPDCSERMYGNFLHPHGPGADPAQP